MSEQVQHRYRERGERHAPSVRATRSDEAAHEAAVADHARYGARRITMSSVLSRTAPREIANAVRTGSEK